MPNWIAYLHYTNGKTQEFFFISEDYTAAYEKVSSIFPNIHFELKQI